MTFKLTSAKLFLGLATLLLYCGVNVLAQPIARGYTHFQLKAKNDTIDFIVADTNLTVKKPIFLYCQGSQPVPLFIDFPEQGVQPIPLNNFDVDELRKHYHVVVLSMPKTPVSARLDQLNSSLNYVQNPNEPYSYLPAFTAADYLENYVFRANQVLRHLRKQAWVDSKQLVVAGHSQGSHVALGIAKSNKQITHLGLFGFNPLGRIDQYLRMARKQVEAGNITWKEADSIQKVHIKEYQEMYTSSDAPFAKSWKSFSKSQLNDLKTLEIPVYIAYGTSDINSDFCDLLPLYFIEEGKTNYQLKRYSNLEHNFFPLLPNGYPDYQNGYWREVMNSFVSWSTLQH